MSGALVDLRGGGLLDLVCGTYAGRVYYHINNGTAKSPLFVPVPGAKSPFFNLPGVSGSSYPTFADLRGVGLFDLVLGQGGSPPVSCFNFSIQIFDD